jgi:ATP-binding cassette subfamily F protein 3
LRCIGLSIGYPERVVASDVAVEIDHGSRVAVVGDNGQGKTTFLRTVSGSLEALHGEVRWSYGCDIGCYAQHVYTSMPEHYTVREYLSTEATADVTLQTVLDIAGSFLFRGDDVDKQIAVLSGGERARLCLAGLLLGRHSVLILDEPCNHLDVETVEALADALKAYQGTVVFTSHDRSFLERMASSVIEVRDGRVTNYLGDYSAYLYRVRKEIDEGRRTKAPPRQAAAPETEQSKAERKARNRRRHELRTQLESVERQMTKYSAKKALLDEQLATVTAPVDFARLKEEHIAVSEKLTSIEERWLVLQQESEKEGGIR